MTKVETAPITEEAVKNWSQLLTQVRADGKLKQRLVNTPLAVLQEHGIEVPAGVEIRVVENTDKVKYVTLPSTTQLGELTSDELTQVSGGNPLLMAAAFFTGYGIVSLALDVQKTGTLKAVKKPTTTTPPK